MSVALSPDMPGHLIRRLHQHSTQLFGQRVQAAGSDLTSVQFAALDALRFHPGIDQAGLAEAIAKDRATIGAVVDRLEQKGLVARVVSPRDKRARVLSLTPAGAAVMAGLVLLSVNSPKIGPKSPFFGGVGLAKLDSARQNG